MALKLRYREDKATQAAARLMRQEGGRMSHMKLIKLLYLADRMAIVGWGRPITFDWYFSLPHGPVLSFTLDKINAEPDPASPTYWHKYISERRGNEVVLIREGESDQLSPAEEELLDRVFVDLGGKTQWELRDLCHKLPEWQDPQGSNIPIRVRDILASEGFDETEIREIEDVLEAESFADSLKP